MTSSASDLWDPATEAKEAVPIAAEILREVRQANSDVFSDFDDICPHAARGTQCLNPSGSYGKNFFRLFSLAGKYLVTT